MCALAGAAATGCSWRPASRSTRSTSIPRARPAADRHREAPLFRGALFNLRRREIGGADPLVRIALDQLDVRALDPNQPGRAGAARRMQVALVINIRIARRELVVAQRKRLARLLRARRRPPFVLGQDGFADRLAVARPGRAV